MKLTDGEKLVVVMLSEIYEHLKINGEVDPKFVRSAISNGNLWGLEWEYPGLFGIEETPEVVVKHAINTLDMWAFIEHGYAKLQDDDKAQLIKDVGSWAKDPKFRGYDGNSETEYMGAARFLVEDMGRFAEFKGRDFNSHMPCVDGYSRMYSVFEPIRSTLADASMSVNQLAQVLSAWRA